MAPVHLRKPMFNNLNWKRQMGTEYRCDCSLCQKKAIAMKAEHKSQFRLTAGSDQLSFYKWNMMIAQHCFARNVVTIRMTSDGVTQSKYT